MYYSYFWWWLKSVSLFIGNFLGWLTYDNGSCSIIDIDLLDVFVTECKSLITGWTNANGFFVDNDGDVFSFVDVFVFNCDIDEIG